MTALLDATGAAKKAREHFETVHGTFAVLGFQVDDARHQRAAGRWEVTCRFYPLAGERTPLRYKVAVDARSGSVLQVERIEEG